MKIVTVINTVTRHFGDFDLCRVRNRCQNYKCIYSLIFLFDKWDKSVHAVSAGLRPLAGLQLYEVHRDAGGTILNPDWLEKLSN